MLDQENDIFEEILMAALQSIQKRDYKGRAQDLDKQILIRVLGLVMLGALRYNEGHSDQGPYRQAQSLLMGDEEGMPRRKTRTYTKYIKKRYDDLVRAIQNDDKVPQDLRGLIEIRSIV